MVSELKVVKNRHQDKEGTDKETDVARSAEEIVVSI
jgi:hypothetical protein